MMIKQGTWSRCHGEAPLYLLMAPPYLEAKAMLNKHLDTDVLLDHLVLLPFLLSLSHGLLDSPEQAC